MITAAELNLSTKSTFSENDAAALQVRIGAFLTKFTEVAHLSRHRNASYVMNQLPRFTWNYVRPNLALSQKATQIASLEPHKIQEMAKFSFEELENPMIIEAPMHANRQGMTYTMVLPGPGENNVWFIRADAKSNILEINPVFLSLNLDSLPIRARAMQKVLDSTKFKKIAGPTVRPETLILFDTHLFDPEDGSSVDKRSISTNGMLESTLSAIGSVYMMHKPSPGPAAYQMRN